MTLVLPLNSFAVQKDNIETKPRPDLIEYEKKATNSESIVAPQIQLVESEKNDGDKKTFFPYRASLSFRVGAAANIKKLKEEPPDKEIPMVLGFKYMAAKDSYKHPEFGFDLVPADDPLFFLNAGYKYIIDHTDYLRPYYKIGVAMRFDEGDHLETPFDFKSYSIVGSIGLEDMIKDPGSVRIDLDLHLGKEDQLIFLCAGWSYAF